MKKFVFPLVLALLFSGCSLFKKTSSTVSYPADCSVLELDLQKGTLNGIRPSDKRELIKDRFNCFTGETEDGSAFNCGGGIFFLDHDFYFYTHRDYLEVRSSFIGNATPNIMGASVDEVKDKFGEPQKIIKENTWLYKMPYGTLRVKFASKRVIELAIHSDKPENVELCE